MHDPATAQPHPHDRPRAAGRRLVVRGAAALATLIAAGALAVSVAPAAQDTSGDVAAIVRVGGGDGATDLMRILGKTWG